MKKQHPLLKDIPLNEWKDGWLTMEVASKLNDPYYLTMLTRERKELNYPCSRQEQINYLRANGNYK